MNGKNSDAQKQRMMRWMRRTGKTPMGLTGGRPTPKSAYEEFRKKPYYLEQAKGDHND